MTPQRMWAIVGLFALAYWGTSTDPIYPTLLLEFLSGEFGVGKAAASLPVVMACLGGAIGAIGSGLLANRVGVGRWVFIGLWGFAACSVLNALDTPLWLFDVTRLFTGLFQGILSLQFLLAIGALVPEERRGTAIGVISAGMLFAVAAGPLLIRATQPPDSPWHMPFWFFGGAVLIAALGLHALRLPGKPEGGGESVSAWDLLHDTQTLMLMALGGILLVSIVAMGSNFTIFAKQQFGWELHQLLPQMITLGVGGIAGALVGGKLSDWMGPRAILIWSSLLVAIFFVIVPPLTSRPWAVYPVFFIMAALAAARVPPYQALMLAIIPPKAQGPILALRNTISYIGTAIGAGFGAFLYQITGTYMAVALFAGAFGLLALWIVIRWVPKR